MIGRDAHWVIQNDRRVRLDEARTWAGYRQAHFARTNGVLVVVVNAEEQGLDPDGGETAWYTICADHDRIMGHSTLKLAKAHAADPEGWCEVCSGVEEPDTEGRWVGSV